MAGTVLYVVDMQPAYSGCHNIVSQVKREISLAKRRGDPIVIVELGPTKTLPEITKAANYRYDKVFMTKKNGSDGSKELLRLMEKMGLPLNRVRVCGVNRTACVYQTVSGLTRQMKDTSKIEVACNATIDGGCDHAWVGYSKSSYDPLVENHGIKLIFH